MIMLIWYVIMMLVYYGVGSIRRGDSRWKCLSEEIRIYERIRGVGWVDRLWLRKMIEIKKSNNERYKGSDVKCLRREKFS